MRDHKIKADDFYEETVFCWICPRCKVVNFMIEEPNLTVTDLVVCDNCNEEVEVEK